MVALPVAQLHTVVAIYAAYEAANQQYDGIALPISLVGTDCDRALWYTLHWASQPEVLTGQKLRRFGTGNVEEARLIEDLRRAGFEVTDVDPQTGKQFKVHGIGGHLRGKLDGIVSGLPEASATVHALECKSHNDKSFKELIKKGLQSAKPNHYAQCQMYCHLMSLTRCLYLAVNKNTDELFADRVPYDATFCLQLLTRIERIVGDARAPSRIAEDPSKWPCVLCQHKAVCHAEAFGRNHCRTCLHATPLIDKEGTDAPWVCERFGRTLSLDEQKAGCPAHLYLPDVVPGQQVNASDVGEWVEYRMRDGSTWRDGVRQEAAE